MKKTKIIVHYSKCCKKNQLRKDWKHQAVLLKEYMEKQPHSEFNEKGRKIVTHPTIWDQVVNFLKDKPILKDWTKHQFLFDVSSFNYGVNSMHGVCVHGSRLNKQQYYIVTALQLGCRVSFHENGRLIEHGSRELVWTILTWFMDPENYFPNYKYCKETFGCFHDAHKTPVDWTAPYYHVAWAPVGICIASSLG